MSQVLNRCNAAAGCHNNRRSTDLSVFRLNTNYLVLLKTQCFCPGMTDFDTLPAQGKKQGIENIGSFILTWKNAPPSFGLQGDAQFRKVFHHIGRCEAIDCTV